MKKKITLKTLQNVLNEVDYASKDKNRTIDDIKDEQIKMIIKTGAQIAISSGFVKRLAGAGVMAAVAGGAGAALAGGGAVAIGGGAAALAGAGVGAAAGAPVPVVGPIIGAVAGLGVGALVGFLKANENKNEKQRLYQEVLAKQKGIIDILKKELETLEKELHRTQQQNKRYEYIIGVLAGFKDVADLCAA